MRHLIVGGSTVPIDDYPFMVRLYASPFAFTSLGFCGGSMINEATVLTAAHCVDSVTAKKVRVGTFKANSEYSVTNRCSDIVQVTEIVLHPLWYHHLEGNDLALLRLERVPNCFHLPTEGPKTISMDNGTFWDASAFPYATATGWGDIHKRSQQEQLRAAQMQVYSRAYCTQLYSAYYNLPMDNGCAGNITGDVDSCSGDSGGPLFVTHVGEHVQIGIVSWGVGCGRPDLPGVYVRIDAHDEFLRLANDDPTNPLHGTFASVLSLVGINALLAAIVVAFATLRNLRR